MPAPAHPKRSGGRRLRLRATATVPAGDAAAPARRSFRMVANTGEPMLIEASALPVVVDLASIDLSGLPIPALYDHRPEVDAVVGQVTAATVRGSTLDAEGVFTLSDSGDPARNFARKVLEKADAGYQWQVSVGGDPASLEEVKAGQSVVVNGRTYQGPVCVARGLVLREISFVVLGGDRRTSAVVTRLKGLKGKTMNFEQFVQSMGFDPTALDETQTANMQLLFDEQKPAEGEEVSAEGETPPGEEEEEAVVAEGETPPPEEEDPAVAAEGEEGMGEEEEPAPTNAGARKPKLNAAQARQAERARVTEITRLVAAHGNPKVTVKGKKTPLMSAAVAGGWSVNTVKTHLLNHLRNSRPAGPTIISRGKDKDCTREALQAALFLRAGGKLDYQFKNRLAAHALKLPAWMRAPVNDAARDRLMNAAHHYYKLSAVDLCREALRLDGVSAPHDRDEMVRAAIVGRPRLTAASSGSALSNIFSSSVNALLLMGYEQSPDTTVGWVSESDVNNFQTQERVRIDIGGGLKKLPRGKTAEHADYSDSVESYKLARYAKMFEVDEQDLADDNLNGLDSVPDDMGKAAARLRPDLVYAIILDNANLNATGRGLFNTTDGNQASSGAALSYATLRDGIKAMALFRENSVNLNLQPTHLIVGPENELLAFELTQSPQILYGADDETVRGNLNALKMKGLTPVVEARLSNGVVDPNTGDSESGSTTAWYLASTMAHTIEVGYLRGSGRAPRVRSYVLDKGRYGMGWDVSMDIGAKALDWKGLYKNAGA